MEIRFVLTACCNYNCYFCLNEYVGEKKPEWRLFYEDFIFIVKSLEELNIKEITLTGGEPLMRDDFYQIVAAIKKRENNVTVVTNGSLINQKISSFEYIDELHISIHSLAIEDYNRIIGLENFFLLKSVIDNIKIIRNKYPFLKIKINIVSEKGNNSPEMILQYIDFASQYNLEINVFKEGYTKIATLYGIKNNFPDPSPLWDLSQFNPVLIDHKPRKTIYEVNGVKVSLSYTSSDENSYDSLWISPTAIGFSDIFQRSPAINLLQIIKDRDEKNLLLALQSLIDEANIGKKLANKSAIYNDTNFCEINRLIDSRKENFETIFLL